MRPLAVIQYLGGLMVVVPAALIIGDWRFDMSLPLLAVLAWSVLALSVVSISLLLYLIRRGQVARAASLNYLMPPAVAIQAMILFGEHLSVAMIVGTIITVTGVYLINRKAG
jgi:drug/metabolite transporter (DMT)-like permease